MTEYFRSIGLSYKKAPLDIRELVALDNEQITHLLGQIKDVLGLEEVLILSTCNRTEIYYSHEEALTHPILELLGLAVLLPEVNKYSQYFDVREGLTAVRHLFRVSLGLDAQVLGDQQISNQVKRAYQASADLQLAGPFLHRLMHTIFFSNKRVVQETPFRDGAASVSYAAVELAEGLTTQFQAPKALVIGVGEIGSDVVRNCMNSRFSSVTVINRTYEKAQALATECGFEAAPIEELPKVLQSADVIISTVSGHEPLISRELVASLDILTYKFFLDLSVPRSVAEDAEEVAGALVYNVDAIHAKTGETLAQREKAIPQVEAIIEDSLHDFMDWSQEMIVSPTIKKLKGALEQIRMEEMARHLKKFNAQEQAAVEMVTKSMMQKIIKLPVLQLKAACKRGEAETLIDVLNDLFDLESSIEAKEVK
ncbi:MAG TPA: glutamyl-tRNA reductase [Cytophagales bacterium]|nr:glutamyl-tRNA reductase [Cytophagales bacterium]HAP64228.1 glutamyl-tRNA reductase [Cytophagales bacterium]